MQFILASYEQRHACTGARAVRMYLSTAFFKLLPVSLLHVFIHFFLKKIHVCLVVHEYKHELHLKKKNQNPPPAWRHAADSCLPHLFHVFSALTCKGGADGSGPFLLLLAKVYFAPTLAPSLWMPPTPSPSCGRRVPCGSPHSCNTWEINQALCWQPLKQEDGELHETSGIHDRYFHNRLKKEREIEGGKQGSEGAVVFEGE